MNVCRAGRRLSAPFRPERSEGAPWFCPGDCLAALAQAAAPGRARLWHTSLLIAASLVSNLSFGHAIVIDSVPKNGATLRIAPQQIELRFNVRIEQGLARATLRMGNAEPLTLSPLRAAPDQSERLIIPLPPLRAAEHEVRYKVLATDGHATQGVLRFRVLP